MFKTACSTSAESGRFWPAHLGCSELIARPIEAAHAKSLAIAFFVGTVLAGCAATPIPTAKSIGLEGTRWQLAVVTSMDDSQPPLRPADPARYTIEFAADGRLLVQLDCNRGHAQWKAEPAPDASAERRSGSLLFGPLATTRMACQTSSLEPRLAAILPYVRSFVIENGQLHLSLMADGGIVSWNPVAADRPAR